MRCTARVARCIRVSAPCTGSRAIRALADNQRTGTAAQIGCKMSLPGPYDHHAHVRSGAPLDEHSTGRLDRARDDRGSCNHSPSSLTPYPRYRTQGSMGLEMKSTCERCQAALAHGDEAFICSYECTFCPSCS